MDKFRKIVPVSVAAFFAAFFSIFIVVSTPKTPKYTTDKNFLYAMNTIIRHEGGLSNNPNDKGSWTKYGISLRYLQNEHFDLNGDGVISKDDVIQLTRTKADELYYKNWYIKNRYDLIENKIIMTDIMDFSVNTGATQCHKTLRRAVNRIITDPLEINGLLDDELIEIINLLEPTVLHEVFNEEQEKFYRELVKKNPALGVFLKGWLLRSKD